MLYWERLGMLDFLRSGRLKVLLLTLCIAAALFVIYLRLRPQQPARLAPGYTPTFGRGAARNADRHAEEASLSTERNGSSEFRE